MNPSTAVAHAIVDEFVQAGVGHVVLSPGSRSAPIAFAVEAAERAGRLRLHVRIDERSAGFTALGLARVSGPTVLVTTSGTAVANLHPAVLEAHHSGVPLVVVSADRPHELRGTGANQTTDQVHIFGTASRFFADMPAPYGREGESADARVVVGRALAAARGTRSGDPGPVQLNVAFREPLVPDSLPASPVTSAPGAAVDVMPTHLDPAPVVVEHVPETVVVAGDGAGPSAVTFAEAGGYPLLAEPSSGARYGPQALGAYRVVLAESDELQAQVPSVPSVRRVVVFGHPTLSRPVSRLLADEKAELIVVAPSGAPWADAGRRANRVVPGVTLDTTLASPDGAWFMRWHRRDQRWSTHISSALDGSSLTGLDVAEQVWRSVGGGDALVVGSSNPVRDLDLMATPRRQQGDLPLVIANRGLAGIDGTISTATGVALASGQPTTVLLGDVTFLHDVGGLLLAPGEVGPDLRIVVVNDEGGGIFTTLEVGEPRHAEAFERVFGTPHRADIAALCAGYGVAHTLVMTRLDLADALSRPVVGRSVIEASVDRSGLRDLYRTLGLITE